LLRVSFDVSGRLLNYVNLIFIIILSVIINLFLKLFSIVGRFVKIVLVGFWY